MRSSPLPLPAHPDTVVITLGPDYVKQYFERLKKYHAMKFRQFFKNYENSS